MFTEKPMCIPTAMGACLVFDPASLLGVGTPLAGVLDRENIVHLQPPPQ